MNQGERETQAAETIRECRAALATHGTSLLEEAIGHSGTDIVDWRHYPEDEGYDPVTHVQYFYHRHPAVASRPGGQAVEAGGHFHLFLRGEGVPAGISPMLFADAAVAREKPPASPQSAPSQRGRRQEVCHLVAITIGRGGEPTGLFTTNRWVTGETWYRAEDMIRLIDRIRFDPTRPARLLDRWIEATVCLFATQIAELLAERDKSIHRWRWRWPRSNAFEDERLEVTSSCAIDLEARLNAVEARGLAAAPRTALSSLRRIAAPVAGDGWGR